MKISPLTNKYTHTKPSFNGLHISGLSRKYISKMANNKEWGDFCTLVDDVAKDYPCQDCFILCQDRTLLCGEDLGITMAFAETQPYDPGMTFYNRNNPKRVQMGADLNPYACFIFNPKIGSHQYLKKFDPEASFTIMPEILKCGYELHKLFLNFKKQIKAKAPNISEDDLNMNARQKVSKYETSAVEYLSKLFDENDSSPSLTSDEKKRKDKEIFDQRVADARARKDAELEKMSDFFQNEVLDEHPNPRGI